MLALPLYYIRWQTVKKMDEIINESRESFGKEFCEYLEYHLSRTLRSSVDMEIRKFWCDGIVIPDPRQLTKKNVNSERQIQTKAWIGTDGQTEFFTHVGVHHSILTTTQHVVAPAANNSVLYYVKEIF